MMATKTTAPLERAKALPLGIGLTPEQLAMRKTGLTATDMKKLAGCDPHGGSGFDVYLDKVGESAPEDEKVTIAKRLGSMQEAIACSLLETERGLVLSRGTTERHPICDWVLATPDRNVLDRGTSRVALVEAKSVGPHMLHRWVDGPPDEVLVQCNWQMTTTRTQFCFVPVILGGTDFRIFEVARDEELFTALLELGDKFWKEHVLARVPPAPDGSASATRMLKGLFTRNKRGMLTAGAEANKLAALFLEARAARQAAEVEEQQAENAIKLLLGDAEGFEGGGWRCTWKNDKTGGVDWKGVAATFEPGVDLVKSYTRPGPRKFLLKATKEKA
jgi:predicted phage-related endonuclease